MFFTANTLDDLMLPVMKELLKRPFNVHEKKTSEIIGAMLHLNNPRARISRSETKGKPFSALGELLWYLSKDKKLDFISYYISAYKVESDDGKTIYGGYGPRLFKLRKQINQIESVISLLKKRPSTRQAVIQIFDGEDLKVEHNNIPCTCTIQLL